MATISEINQGFGYQGNAELSGASGFGVGKLDTKPLEDLAKYTFLRNKSEYDQKQKNADEMVIELGKLSTYDPSNSIPEERQDAIDAYERAKEAGREYAATLSANPEDKVKNLFAYKDKVQKEQQKLDLLKARNVSYIKWLDDINKETNVDKKAAMKSYLNEKIKQTKGTLLPLEPEVNTEFAKPGEVGGTGVDVFYKMPNTNQTVTTQIYNWAKAEQLAAGIDMDFQTKELDPNSPEFKNLSTEMQGVKKYEATLRGINRKNGWASSADNFNQVVNTVEPDGTYKYRKDGLKDGELDVEKLKEVKIAGPVLEQIMTYNEKVRAFKKDIEDGRYVNQSNGKPFGFDDATISSLAKDAKEINWQDGVSGGELAKVIMYANWEPKQLREIKATETDNAIQQAQIAAQIRGQDVSAATTRRGQDLENDRFWAGFKKNSNEDIFSADAVIREASDAILSGKKITIKTYSGNTDKVKATREVVEVADPNLLREFGTIDKDGNVTNVPDVVHFDQKSNKMSLVYYKKERSDPSTDATDKTLKYSTKNGEPVVDRMIDMQPTQWLGQITKRKNPNKDIGTINTLIDEVYNKYSRSLQKLSEGYKGGATITDKKGTSESGSVGGSKTVKVKGL